MSYYKLCDTYKKNNGYFSNDQNFVGNPSCLTTDRTDVCPHPGQVSTNDQNTKNPSCKKDNGIWTCSKDLSDCICYGKGVCVDAKSTCDCNDGYDPADQCGRCLPGYTGYPNCKRPPEPDHSYYCYIYGDNSCMNKDDFINRGGEIGENGKPTDKTKWRGPYKSYQECKNNNKFKGCAATSNGRTSTTNNCKFHDEGCVDSSIPTESCCNIKKNCSVLASMPFANSCPKGMYNTGQWDGAAPWLECTPYPEQKCKFCTESMHGQVSGDCTCPGDPPSCFGSKNIIQTRRGKIKIKDLVIGDFVLTSTIDGIKEECVFYIRNHGFKNVEHLKLTLSDDSEIIVTQDHLLYLNNDKLIKACHVNVGDKLKSINESVIITKISKIMDIPLTPCVISGNIILGNTVVSCWTDNEENANKMNMLMELVKNEFIKGTSLSNINIMAEKFYNEFHKGNKNIKNIFKIYNEINKELMVY